jgi:citronellyl-CoA synthetase
MTVREVFNTLKDVVTVLRAAKALKPKPPETVDSIGARVATNAVRFGDRPALLFEGQTTTWRELNALANRYAHYYEQIGLGRGDAVSLFMENRIEFLANVIALHKLGAVVALINTNLRGQPLVHCINVAESRTCVFGEELTAAIQEAKADLKLEEGRDYVFVADTGKFPAPNWATDLGAVSAKSPDANPAATDSVTLGDNAFYVYTSGTTGLPKAAVMTQRRFLATASVSHMVGLRLTEQDRLYLCLPLYHATGLVVGWGGALLGGSSAFIRRKFSASRFLDEVRQYNTTTFVYIGELCRYLLNTPERADDADNPLTRVIGNGLRPDVWMKFKTRFGIKRVTEFYGASEGNAAFMNLLNKDRTIGLTVNKIALVEYDVYRDEIVRDDAGHCRRVKPGEPGLLLAKITPDQVFEGYTNSEATEKKIIRNAFESGDAWFNSGDLIRQVKVGFAATFKHYQFVDRVGDTFRWRSENVSTNEVGEILNQHPQVSLCNVYGVEIPGADGRAGMAAVTLAEGVDALDIDDFSAFVTRALPPYAQPVFIRVQHDIDVTGTFKMVKGDLKKQGYDINAVADPIYVMKPRASVYERLERGFYNEIVAGTSGY